MENLSLHIEYLLLRHDCVIVPGIGAFINIHHAPYFDKESGCIVPPKREIRFNPALRSDDGMLANSFARKLEVPYREGSEILARTIANFSDTLLKEREVTVGRLGLIRMEPEGNIRFYPMKSDERYCSDLGLVAAPFVKNSPHAQLSKSNLSGNEKPISKNDSLSKAKDAAEGIESLENYRLLDKAKKMNFERNYYIPVNKLFSKICAILIIIFAFALAWYNYPSTLQKGEERASVLPIDKVIDTAMQRSHNGKSLRQKKAINYEENKDRSELKEENAVSTLKDSEQYYLIVATCKTIEEAKRYIDKHSSSGIEMEIVESKKYYRVSAKQSSRREELHDIMTSPEFKRTFSKSWIWEKEG